MIYSRNILPRDANWLIISIQLLDSLSSTNISKFFENSSHRNQEVSIPNRYLIFNQSKSQNLHPQGSVSNYRKIQNYITEHYCSFQLFSIPNRQCSITLELSYLSKILKLSKLNFKYQNYLIYRNSTTKKKKKRNSPSMIHSSRIKKSPNLQIASEKQHPPRHRFQELVVSSNELQRNSPKARRQDESDRLLAHRVIRCGKGQGRGTAFQPRFVRSRPRKVVSVFSAVSPPRIAVMKVGRRQVGGFFVSIVAGVSEKR